MLCGEINKISATCKVLNFINYIKIEIKILYKIYGDVLSLGPEISVCNWDEKSKLWSAKIKKNSKQTLLASRSRLT
jgi:hypothetical protein